MRIKIALVIILVMGVLAQISGQSTSELTTRALENNLELKMLKTDYLAALEKAPQVNELPDPEVGIGVFPLPVETRLGAQLFRVGATQMFPWFGTLDQMAAVENAKARAIYEKINVKALDIRYQVENTSYKLYEIDRSIVIIRRNLELLWSLERLSISKVENGEATGADILRVQLKIEELVQELAILKNKRIGPQSLLNQLLYQPLSTNIKITDSISFAIIPYKKDSLMGLIKDSHPLLRMFELQQNIARERITLNGLNSKPTYGVGLDYLLVQKRGDADPSGNGRDIVQLKASIKIPIYRKKYAAKDREEKFKIESLQYRSEDVLSKFMSTIDAAFSEYENASLRKSLYEKQIEITQGAIRILNTSYSTKGQNFDELLRLEKELIDYDLKILRAIIQSQMAKAKIEKFIY